MCDECWLFKLGMAGNYEMPQKVAAETKALAYVLYSLAGAILLGIWYWQLR
jgi:hypothetical protein